MLCVFNGNCGGGIDENVMLVYIFFDLCDFLLIINYLVLFL